MGLLKRSDLLTAEQRSWITEKIGYLIAGEVPRPQIDLGRLAAAEQQELRELLTTACGKDRMPAVARLGKSSRRAEQLVAKAGGLPEEHYEHRRREAQTAAKKAERDAMARRLPLNRDEEKGFFATMFAALTADDLWLDDVAVLAGLLAQFAAGRPFSHAGRFEGSGRDLALVVDANMGLWGPVDASGAFDGTLARLTDLGQDGWLVLDRRGPQLTIRLGPRLLEAFDGVPYEPATARAEPELIG